MKEVKDALLRVVRATMKTKHMQEKYLEIGIDDQPWFDIWGDQIDAIYALLGEHTDTLEESVTYVTMTAPYLTDERRTEMLFAEYQKNHKQPSPNTMSSDGMKELYEHNGGYLRETPEGDWT